jgi:hypothetical protein
MPALTPQITLTATLKDFSGVNNGSIANPSKIRIALCNFGPYLARVPGTCIIDKPGPNDILCDGTSWPKSIPLWGNDVIKPAGTFYAISILDDRNNVLQTGIYQFAGTGTIDLADAPQVIPGTGPLPYMYGEEPAGAYPGTIYTLTKIYANGIVLFYNAGFLNPDQYTVLGSVITLHFTTQVGDSLYALGMTNDPGGGGTGTPTGVWKFEVPLLSPAGGNFTIPHGLGTTPTCVLIQMTSLGAIVFQPTRYDATNLYLQASAGGLTGFAEVFF